MAEEHEATHGIPSDLSQIPTVWRYEVLRYFRSRRLLAALVVVGVILSLIYILPPLYDSPYSGTDTEVSLHIDPAYAWQVDDPEYIGSINRTAIDEGTLEIFVDGEPYPSLDGVNWVFSSGEAGGLGFNAVLFMQNVSGLDVTATYEWYTPPESFASNFIGFVSILVIICVTFFAADSLVGEFQNKTGYLLFPNAVKRGTLFAGKFAASLTMGFVVVGLYYGVVAVLSMVSARGIDDDYMLSFLLAFEYIVAATAIAYFISSLLKGTTGALVLTFLLLLMIFPIVDGVSAVSGVKIEGSVTFAAGAISYILYDPYPVDSMLDTGMGMEFHSFYPTPEIAAIVMLLYAVVACLLSMILFKRKQLAG